MPEQTYYEVVVQPGDSLASLFGDQWTHIYQDAKNSLLRSISPNPDEVWAGQIIYVRKELSEHPKVKIAIEKTKKIKRNWKEMDWLEKFRNSVEILNLGFHDYGKLSDAINSKQEYFLYSTHSKDGVRSKQQLDGLTLSFDAEELLQQVQNGMSCYWVAIEPFRFFLDIDHIERYDIQKILSVMEEYFEYYLVCQTEPITESHYKKMRESFSNYPRHRTCCSVFTNKRVSYDEARNLEYELSKKLGDGRKTHTVNRFDSISHEVRIGPIDPLFSVMSPLVYRRSPFSVHGWFKDRRSLPNLKLSKLPNGMSDLEILRFSNPNFKSRTQL